MLLRRVFKDLRGFSSHRVVAAPLRGVLQQCQAIRRLRTTDRSSGEAGVIFDASGAPVNTAASPKSKNKNEKLITSFSVDRSGLLGITPPKKKNSTAPAVEKEPMTPLAKELVELIGLKGPITIAEFMMQAANHSKHGYYHSKDTAKIGTEGDFVTSPEISQVFGECIGVWCMSTWEILGKPADFTLVELGAGNGTLLKDVLHVAGNFPDFHKALKRVAVVERSQDLRETQCSALKGTEKVFKEESLVSALSFQKTVARSINWYNLIDDIPEDKPIILLAQEFLDAFPVHQLVRNDDGVWSEKVIALEEDDSSPYHFQTMLAPVATPAVKVFEGEAFQDVLGYRYSAGSAKSRGAILSDDTKSSSARDINHTDAVIADTAIKVTTDEPASDTNDITTTSPTCAALNDLMRNREPYMGPDQQWMIPETKDTIRTQVELCPGGLAAVQAVSRKLASDKCTGAALFIDYGENYTQADTLRGYRKHVQKNFLSDPGQTDVTADVDFFAAARAAVQGNLDEHVGVVGPVTQASFLIHMGAVERVQQLIDLDETTEDKAEEIYNAFEYLVDKKHMGEKFKTLALISKSLRVNKDQDSKKE